MLDNKYRSKLDVNSCNKEYTLADSADVAVRVKYTDTATMLTPYLRKVDTASLSSRINTKLATSDSSTYYTKYRSDTSRTNIYSAIGGKQSTLTNPVTGTGTNNQIAYFNSTGSTISSLTTGTYPSLTELSYVKGTTSSVQTQIDNKFTTPTGWTDYFASSTIVGGTGAAGVINYIVMGKILFVQLNLGYYEN